MATADKSKTKNKKRVRAARGTGRLYKRTTDGKEHRADSKTPGVFWIQYTLNGKRKRHALTGTDGKPITDLRKAEAERKRLTAPLRSGKRKEQLKALTAQLAQTEAEHEQDKEEAAPILSIAEAWEAYLQSPDRPDTGEDTLRYYGGYWNGFTDWLKEKHEDIHALRNITPQIASEYAANLNDKTVSPNTYNKHTAFLKLFFRVLEDAVGLKANPFAKVRRKNLKTNVHRELTIAELKEILESATGDLQTLFCIGIFTGLRLGDCCTLKWGEVDLDRGIIRRIPNKTAKNGKPVLIGIPGALHAKLSEIPPQERKGYIVPRFAELYTYRNAKGRPTKQPNISNEIQKHFKACGIQVHKEGTGYKKVPDPTGKHKYLWKHTGKRAVVEVGFHSLRHTWISLHAAAGTPQSIIQNVIGHANPAMTAHYTHVNEETARQVAGVLTLKEPEQAARTVPPWIVEKLKEAVEKNDMQIIEKLIGGAE